MSDFSESNAASNLVFCVSAPYIKHELDFPHRPNSKDLSGKRRSFLMKQKSDWKRITLLRKTSFRKEIRNIGR